MDCWGQSGKNIYVAAHRGLSWRYPENTIPAFEAALEVGVDQIEFDVHVTKDGELVVIHDSTVDRTTDGTGAVEDFTLAELRKLNAGVKFDRNCQIPTLREVLELVKDVPRLTLDVELKEYPTEGREALAYDVCDRALAMVEAYGYGDRCVVNSFSGVLLEYVAKKYHGKYRLHAYYPTSRMEEASGGAQGLRDPSDYAYCICVSKRAEPEVYDRLRQKGVQPWCYASKTDEAVVEYLIRSGALLLTCDDPEVALELLRSRGYHA